MGRSPTRSAGIDAADSHPSCRVGVLDSTARGQKACATHAVATTRPGREALIRIALLHSFQSVAQHVLLVQSEPWLVKELCDNDAASAARMLANSSGLSALLAVFVNQVGGKLSDAHGRKMFLLLGPATNVLCGTLVYMGHRSLALVLFCRMLRLLATTFSNSVMVWSSLADVLEGHEFKSVGVQMSAVIGASVLLTPFLETAMLQRTKHPRFTYLALAATAGLQLLSSAAFFPETLAPSSQRTVVASRRSGTLDGWNPLGFTRLFTSGSKALSQLTVITTLQLLLDGKNMSDIQETWKRDHLGWSVGASRNMSVLTGAATVLSSMVLTRQLLKALTNRRYTSFANVSCAVALLLRGSSTSAAFVFSMFTMLPGINGASTKALQARGVQLAKRDGLGMGEYAAWSSNARSLANAIHPVVIGNFYAWCLRRGYLPGSVFWLMGLLGAVLPEVLASRLSDAEIEDDAVVKRE